MKRIVLVVGLVLMISSALGAKPWVLVSSSDFGHYYVLDLGTWPVSVLGFFNISLIVGLLDVEPYPNNCYALFSTHDAGAVVRIDITDPNHPIESSSLDLSGRAFAPLDIAIPKEGGFAVVGEGSNMNRIVFIDLTDPDFKTYSIYHLKTDGAAAEAVAVTPDGQTVIICDSWHNRIIYGQVNESKSGLVSENTLSTQFLPINVSISPDGRTALVVNFFSQSFSVLRIDGPGAVVPGSPSSLLVWTYPQSIAFSPDGSRAYIYSTSYSSWPDRLSCYSVIAPGQVNPHITLVDLMSKSGAAYFGVDLLAVSLDGMLAIAGGWLDPGGLSQVLLDSYDVSLIPLKSYEHPRGLAVFDEALVYPPAEPTCTRLVNDFIFYKEYVNRLTWSVNPNNLGAPVTVRIYRKNLGEPDSEFQLLQEFDQSLASYDDRGLRKDQNFVYRFTSVLRTGKESLPTDLETNFGGLMFKK